MGKVQSTIDTHGKIALLERFADEESEPSYVASAEKMIESLKE